MPDAPDNANDSALLHRFATTGDKAAFAEFVRRRIDFVYASALRQLRGDTHRAQDIVQTVFTDVARKAAPLSRHRVLAGWLHTATRFAAAKSLRTEARRHQREQEAHAMQQILADSTPPVDWTRLQPVLDEALGELKPRERDAILLRFFEGRPFAEIAASLSLTETATRSCIDRALDKLHAQLTRRGIGSTTAALAAALTAPPLVAAPAALAASVTGTALAGAAATVGASLSLLSLGQFLAMNKVQTGLLAALALASVTTFSVQLHATRTLEARVAGLQFRPLDLRSLQAENQSLTSALAALSPDSAAADELSRLQRRAAELSSSLRGTPFPSSQGRTISREEAAARERRSPYLALQGVIRAVFADDHERLSWLLAFDAPARAKLDHFFSQLPPEVQARHRTPEALVARVFVQWFWQGDPPRRYGGDGVKETPVGADGARVDLPVTTWSGREVVLRPHFQRREDGWRLGPITADSVDEILALLDPATAAPRSEPQNAFYSRKR